LPGQASSDLSVWASALRPNTGSRERVTAPAEATESAVTTTTLPWLNDPLSDVYQRMSSKRDGESKQRASLS
jgi:hypothetical protein